MEKWTQNTINIESYDHDDAWIGEHPIQRFEEKNEMSSVSAVASMVT